MPTFMQPQQNAGAKRVSGARGPGNIIWRQFQRRLPEIFAFAGPGKGAFREMNHDQFADTLLEERTGGVPEGDQIERPVARTDLKAGGLARLDFIEDTV